MCAEGTEPGLEAAEYFDEDSGADALSADAEGMFDKQNCRLNGASKHK